MRYQVTVRHGGSRQRYHTYVVEASDARAALAVAAESMPAEVAEQADLVELRVAVDPERREYLSGDMP